MVGIEQLKSRVSMVAVAIFVCGLATEGFSYYLSTVVAQQINSELRSELPPSEMRQLDAAIRNDASSDDADSSPGSHLFGTLIVLAAICAAGYFGATQERSDSLCCFSCCNLCNTITNACTCCMLFVLLTFVGAMVASLTPLLQHCDASELCPLTEGRTPDANGLVGDLHSIDCLAKGMWPEQYQRIYPDFGTPLGYQCGHEQITVLFLNCTANNAMTTIEAAQHKEAFQNELIEWPAHVLAEDTVQRYGRYDVGQARHRQPRAVTPPPMPSNVLEACRANEGMMEGFHHAKTLVPEIWDTVSVDIRVMQFLYGVCSILALLGFMWGWQLHNLIKQRTVEGTWRQPGGGNQVVPEYTRPLLTNTEYSQPWNAQQQAVQQAPRQEPPQAQPQAQPQAPVGQFVVTCPEFTHPGQTICVTNPATGQQVEVQVPDGVNPGQQFAVAV